MRELADRLEVSGRTIRRDIERLRELGYPVESLTGPAGGYRLASGTAMPPLLLDDDEAIAIAVGLRTAARASVAGIEETSVRALVKLEQVLPSHLRRRVRALGAATITIAGGGPTVDPQSLSVIAAACRDHERRSLRLPRPRRRRDPARGRAALAGQPRASLVPARLGSRARGLAHLPRRPAQQAGRRPGSATPRASPPAKDAAEFVARSISSAPQRYEARVTLHTSAAAAREHLPAQWGTIEPIDERTCEYRTGDYDLDWLALRIAMLGVDFDVHEPPELVEHLRALGGRDRRRARGRGLLARRQVGQCVDGLAVVAVHLPCMTSRERTRPPGRAPGCRAGSA